jgi:hypothetical protein
MRASRFGTVIVALGGLLASLTAGVPADAECSIGGCPWPSDCYNLKKEKWCAAGSGISQVDVQNNGSYESAFDWARAEISSPKNGIDNSLALRQVGSGGEIKVFDYTGGADWWGLADSYTTTSGSDVCLKSVRVQINRHFMTSYIRKQYTMLHELGHAVGLNHVCVCPRTMNPCGTCGDDGAGTTPYLSQCDAKGVREKYDCKKSQRLCEDKCCSAPSHAEPTCSSGSCGFTCDAGHSKCSGKSCCASGSKCCSSGACVLPGAPCPA